MPLSRTQQGRKTVKTVLYIEHSKALGGSAVSLLYTLQALDRTRFRPIVALTHPSAKLNKHYTGQGIETIGWPGICTFNHTALGWTAFHRPLTWPAGMATASGWIKSERRTCMLINQVCPDLVHLNSAVLLPSARALFRSGIPFVWHVREGGAYGHFGLRFSLMRRAMLRWPSEVIFLSEAEHREWTDGARGRVITELVEFKRFDRRIDGRQVRRELGIADDARVVLYFGGLLVVKGIFPLLQALAFVKSQEPKVVCLMPGSIYEPSGRWMSKVARAVLPSLGYGTRAQRVEQTINSLGLGNTCIRTAHVSGVERLLAACDLVVFPATTNHFARPVIEAGAMAKPAVASLFPILQELVRHEETGLLVPPRAPKALADAIVALLRDPYKRAEFGERAYAMAKLRYDATNNTNAVMRVYDDVIAARPLRHSHQVSQAAPAHTL
jgi:glycosyltransferase involved in cell wall biosynthesis